MNANKTADFFSEELKNNKITVFVYQLDGYNITDRGYKAKGTAKTEAKSFIISRFNHVISYYNMRLANGEEINDYFRNIYGYLEFIGLDVKARHPYSEAKKGGEIFFNDMFEQGRIKLVTLS